MIHFVFSLQTSTITDTVSSVVTITPSQPLALTQQLNTLDFNTEKLGPKPEENRSFGAATFHNHNALNQQQDSLDSFEALQAYLSKFQQSSVLHETALTTEATTTTTTTRRSLISRLKSRKDAYRARFFKPKTNLIKEAISSSLYSVSVVSSTAASSSSVALESSFPAVSSVSPAHLATSPIPGPVLATNVVINVASNVRVAGGGEANTRLTPVYTPTPAQTSVSTVTSDGGASDNDALSEDDIIISDDNNDAQSVTVQTILALPSRPDIVKKSSVITVYLSGSVPGVFSTSLSTIIYDGIRDEKTEDMELIDRKKRHVEAIIEPTRTVHLDNTEISDDYLDIIASGLNDIVHSDSWGDKRATVTVTSTVLYCPVL